MNEENMTATGRRLAAAMETVAAWDDVRAMVVGERAKLEADGFSPTAAEQMAQALWMSVLFPQMMTPPPRDDS